MLRNALSAIFVVAILGAAAIAHEGSGHQGSGQPQHSGGYRGGFGGRSGGFGGYRGGFGGYYGNGRHDLQPHWHITQTPYGNRAWFGNGPHDFRPHYHTYTPNSYRGYSSSPWGRTQSFYPRYPSYRNGW